MVATSITSQGLSWPLGTSNTEFSLRLSTPRQKKKNDTPFPLGADAADFPEGTAPSTRGGASGELLSPDLSPLF